MLILKIKKFVVESASNNILIHQPLIKIWYGKINDSY
jgi:hypothetical protein